MPRGKGKVAYVENDTQRKVTYRNRQKVVLKKAQELTTLCNCEVANVRYSEYHTEPVVYPNDQAATNTFRKFMSLTTSEQSKKMMTTKQFTEKIIEKKKEQLYKLQKDNSIKEKRNMMHELVNGKDVSIDMKSDELNDLMYVMKQQLKKMRELKIKVDEEGSTSNASQPISNDGQVLIAPLVSPSTIPSGTNCEAPRSHLLVPDVAQIMEDTVAPLTIPSTPAPVIPQMDSSMNISTMDAPMPMNSYQNYPVGFSQSPPLSELIDWNDSLDNNIMSFWDDSADNNFMSFWDDSVDNNINVQDPNNKNNF